MTVLNSNRPLEPLPWWIKRYTEREETNDGCLSDARPISKGGIVEGETSGNCGKGIAGKPNAGGKKKGGKG